MTSAPTFKTTDDIRNKPISVKTVKPLSASAASSRAPKKIDMGAAFTYGKSSDLGINSPTHRSTHSENLFGDEPAIVTQPIGSKSNNDIIEDIFSSAAAAPNPVDDFDPRAGETTADFGDFASAFGGSEAPAKVPAFVSAPVTPAASEFADFSSAFSAQTSAPAAAAAVSLDDNFLFNPSPAPAQSSNSLLGSADLFGNSVITNAFTSPPAGNKDLLSDFGDLTLNPIQGEQKFSLRTFASLSQVLKCMHATSSNFENKKKIFFKESRKGFVSTFLSAAPRTEQIYAKAAQLSEFLESISRIESTAQLRQLTTGVGELNKLLPTGETNASDLMGSHCSELEDFATDTFPSLLSEIAAKYGKSCRPGDAIPEEIASFALITDHIEFILETMSVLSDAAMIEKATHFIVKILEHLLLDDNYLITAFSRASAANLDEVKAARIDQFIQQLISLPDKISNRMKSDFPPTFERRRFSALLMVNALKTLHVILHINNIEQFSVYNVKFLSKLISKVFVHFKSDKAVLLNSSRLMLSLAERAPQGIRKVVMQMSRQAVETLVTLAFGECGVRKKQLVDGFGDIWKESGDWKYVLCKKLPLLSFSQNDELIENLSWFLAVEDMKQLESLTMELLMVWSTKAHVNDTPLEQHLYVSKLIVLMAKYLADPKERSEKIKKILFTGMQVHLGASDKRIRAIGMITAEVVLGIVDAHLKEDDRLKFDYSDLDKKVFDEIVEVLRAFPGRAIDINSLELLASEGDDGIERSMNCLLEIIDERGSEAIKQKKQALSESSIEVTAARPVELETPANPQVETLASKPPVELDSDDEDLEVYPDIPDDYYTSSDSKQPKYLLDLIQAFTSKENIEDPVRFELSMKAAEQIISEQLPSHHADIAVDLLRIFINLEKACYFEDFEGKKLKILIEITSVHPREAAQYLCNEFNSEMTKYTISKRMMMLEVISETAKRLSKLEYKNEGEASENPSVVPLQSKNKLLGKLNEELEQRNRKDAQKIIRQRLIAKTRRIATRTKAPDEGAGVNRFSEFAGCFFFPLVHGFGRKQMIFKSGTNLKDEITNLLLVKFLNTISVLVLCAEHSLVSPKMAKEIMSLSVFLRYHEEAKIRLAVLHMVSTVLLAIPQKVLVREFQPEINEFVNHLGMIVRSTVVNYEPDQECRDFAKQLMAMFQSVLYGEE